MSNVTQINTPDPQRQARADYIAQQLKTDGRSARYVAAHIGLNHTSLGDRLKGRVPFNVEDLEGIARVLKRDPVDLYRAYISVGLEGFDPPASSVESRELADVLPFRKRA